MKRIFLSLSFLFSLSLAAAETIYLPCNQCSFTFEHEHDGNWIKKHASFDFPREKISYVASQSFVLFHITGSVLEVNFHDLYLREGDWKSVLYNDWIGTRYTPLQLSLTQERLLRLFHTLTETKIHIENSWAMESLMSNWQVFDFNVECLNNEHVQKFTQIYPEIKKIVFNLYPKDAGVSYERNISSDDNFHPLVIGAIKPAEEINKILSIIKDFGIEVEFHEI